MRQQRRPEQRQPDGAWQGVRQRWRDRPSRGGQLRRTGADPRGPSAEPIPSFSLNAGDLSKAFLASLALDLRSLAIRPRKEMEKEARGGSSSSSHVRYADMPPPAPSSVPPLALPPPYATTTTTTTTPPHPPTHPPTHPPAVAQVQVVVEVAVEYGGGEGQAASERAAAASRADQRKRKRPRPQVPLPEKWPSPKTWLHRLSDADMTPSKAKVSPKPKGSMVCRMGKRAGNVPCGFFLRWGRGRGLSFFFLPQHCPRALCDVCVRQLNVREAGPASA